MTERDDVVEQVKTAILCKLASSGFGFWGDTDDPSPSDQHYEFGADQIIALHEACEGAARAAIEAMRTPTTAMWRAYIIAHGHDPDKVAEDIDEQLLGVGALRNWQAMIDAAIKEDKADG